MYCLSITATNMDNIVRTWKFNWSPHYVIMYILYSINNVRFFFIHNFVKIHINHFFFFWYSKTYSLFCFNVNTYQPYKIKMSKIKALKIDFYWSWFQRKCFSLDRDYKNEEKNTQLYLYEILSYLFKN